MVYTRRNANPYVPSASETNLEAKNLDVKQNLTVSNVSTMSLAVLGNMQGLTKCPDGVLVPVYSGSPPAALATVAGLIVVDKITGIKASIDKTADEQTEQADRTQGAKDALDATKAVTTDKADAVTAIDNLTTGNTDYIAGRDEVKSAVQDAPADNLAAAKNAAEVKYLELKQISDIKFKWA